ncbi:hypothetical protein LMG28614_07271 [Paraburkholderia ultramafica]|uniref:Uncharacterized protein n=1 Tax=Paraburkholderia ultramafica TaxID=1544867 RepID=A0A6S7BS58_9BURK|nr:hypothetical protein LMG28614_07271 [Paraburkholderia ultramafica]
MLNRKLTKLLVVEGAEGWRQAAQRSNERELRRHDVNGEPEPDLMRERETVLGLVLRLNERVASREQVCVQQIAGVRRMREIADPIGGVKRAAQQITAVADMPGPCHEVSTLHIGPGLETPQSAAFHQFVAKPPEAKSGLVVAEVRPQHRSKLGVGVA